MVTPQIGIMLPTAPDSAPIATYARHAEQCGLDSLWIGDQLVAGSNPTLDATLVLAAAAGVTEHLGLGTAVLVPAMRPLVWTAKQIVTLQWLSQNRIVLGVGSGAAFGATGWRAAGVPYGERGGRTDDALAVLPDLVAGRPVEINETEIALSPTSPMPPVWVGGNGSAAIRRAARYGETWFPSMATTEQIRAGIPQLEQVASELGRPVPGIAVGAAVGLGDGVTSTEIDSFRKGLRAYGLSDEDAKRMAIIGSPQDAAERLLELAAEGAHHLVLGTFGQDWFKQCEMLAEARGELRRAEAVDGRGRN